MVRLFNIPISLLLGQSRNDPKQSRNKVNQVARGNHGNRSGYVNPKMQEKQFHSERRTHGWEL